jgi:hypothetical protein
MYEVARGGSRGRALRGRGGSGELLLLLWSCEGVPYPCWIARHPYFGKCYQFRAVACCFFDQAACFVDVGREVEPDGLVLCNCDFDDVGHG